MLDERLEAFDAVFMPDCPGQVTFGSPAAIAVHDDCHMGKGQFALCACLASARRFAACAFLEHPRRRLRHRLLRWGLHALCRLSQAVLWIIMGALKSVV